MMPEHEGGAVGSGPGCAQAHLTAIERDVRGLIRELALARAELADRASEYTLRNERLLLSLVEVLDAFERVFADISGREPTITDSVKGWVGNFRTVHRLLVNVIRDQGVIAMESAVGQFDPHQHRAVETVLDSDLPFGTILSEVSRGYALGDRVLRKPGVAVAGRQ
jgi:molecular chaperone GrpE